MITLLATDRQSIVGKSEFDTSRKMMERKEFYYRRYLQVAVNPTVPR